MFVDDTMDSPYGFTLFLDIRCLHHSSFFTFAAVLTTMTPGLYRNERVIPYDRFLGPEHLAWSRWDRAQMSLL